MPWASGKGQLRKPTASWQLAGHTRRRARLFIEEGFSESEMVVALTGKSKILELYVDEHRCLILGTFKISENVRLSLHLVCDYSRDDVVDIVTAYIPQIPRWISPSQRGQQR